MIRFNKIKTKQGFLDVDYSVAINQGDRIALMGANGSGKSSLINAIMNFIKTDNDIDLSIERNRIGYQMQHSAMIEELKVKEYINLIIGKKLSEDEVKEFHLQNIYHKKISVLSGGEKQFLILFLTTYLDKDIIFFDELTTGLDASKRKLVLEELVAKNINTFVLVTHYPYEASKLCNKLMIMQDGNIVEYDYIDEIKNKLNMNYKVLRNNESHYFLTKEEANNFINDELIEEVKVEDILEYYGVSEYE